MIKWVQRARLARHGSLTLGNVIHELAAVHGDSRLVEQAPPSGATLTYRQAAAWVDARTGAIARKTQPGDRVVIATPNSYEMFLLCVAASRAGALPVPVNPKMTAAEVDHLIADSGASVVIRDMDDVVGEPAALAVEADVSATAAIFYSSGTTGQPKGARLTHRALVSQARSAALFPAELRRDEAVVALPVAHIMGFVVVLGFAAAGIPLYFMPRFRPDEVLDAIESRRSTMFIGVPAMYRLMIEAGADGRDLRSVRVWGSGADVMPRDLARRFQRMGASITMPLTNTNLGEALFVEGYGMVEVGGGVAAKVTPPLLNLFSDALGMPLPGYRFKVVDADGRATPLGQVGQLLVKGPGVLEGYHGDPEATRAVLTDDGWLRTGDLVRRGPFGFVAFAGRDKDVIKVGGYSVYATEVQEVLERHHAVAEAAVVGIPDERKGESVAAAVRLMPGEAASEAEIIAFAADQLAEYKVPSAVKIVAELPRTGTDKVKKAGVRAWF